MKGLAVRHSRSVRSPGRAKLFLCICIASAALLAAALSPMAGASGQSLVTQPVKIGLGDSGPAGSATLAGCAVSPASISLDGEAHNFTALAHCTVTITVQADGASSRYRFGASTSTRVVTCGGGVCAVAVREAYYEVLDTYAADARAQPTFDPNLAFNVEGLSGSAHTTVCTIVTIAADSSDSCRGWADNGTVASFPSGPIHEAAGTRWEPAGALSFEVAGGGNTYSLNYFKQEDIVASFTILGGTGGGYSDPTVSYTSLGASASSSLTSHSVQLWMDYASSWSVTNPLSGSGSAERWVATAGTSGTAVASGAVRPAYYNQYNETFNFGVSDASTPTGPTVTFRQFESTVTREVPTDGFSDWVNARTTVTYLKTLVNSTSTERWVASVTSFASSPGGAFDPTYYHQFLVTFGYSTTDSSTISDGAVIGSFFQYGTSTGHTIRSDGAGGVSPPRAWVDAGSGKVTFATAYGSVVTSVASGGDENYIADYQTVTPVRWSPGSSPVSYGVSSSATITEAGYYHQVEANFTYAVINGTALPGLDPAVSYTQYGAPASANATYHGTLAWVDYGSSYSYAEVTPGSNGSVRWAAPAIPSGTIDSPTVVNASYYLQYSDTLQYSVSGGGSPAPPVVNFTSFGANMSQAAATDASSVAWIDAGTTATYPASITDGITTWTTPTTSFVASSSTTFDPTYS